MQYKITYETLAEKLTTEPIIINDFVVYKNKVGYWCFYFTPNVNFYCNHHCPSTLRRKIDDVYRNKMWSFY
jgi:hypothetical protein